MTARSSASRNSRGFGLPACGRGVSVPTSTKPKPSAEHLLGHFGVLVEPGGEPDRRSGSRAPRRVVRSEAGKSRRPARRHQLQRRDRRPMRGLGVEREGERADERVERHCRRYRHRGPSISSMPRRLSFRTRAKRLNRTGKLRIRHAPDPPRRLCGRADDRRRPPRPRARGSARPSLSAETGVPLPTAQKLMGQLAAPAC